MFGGSSRYRLVDGELIEISKEERASPKVAKKQSESPANQETAQTEPTNNAEEKRAFREQTKVKKKCHAFSRLAKSKKFLAFLSQSVFQLACLIRMPIRFLLLG